MQIKNKFSQILRNKAGASLLMVLGIMTLLIIIGVSALVAASANAGAAINQRTNNQLNIYAESVIQTIMHSINEVTNTVTGDNGARVDSGAPDADRPTTLGGQLIRAIYLNEDIEDEKLELKIDLSDIADISDDVEATVTVTFKNVSVDEWDFVPYKHPSSIWINIPTEILIGGVPTPIPNFFHDWDPHISGTAAMDIVDAVITFKVDINYKGNRGKDVAYLLEYELSGVIIEGAYKECVPVPAYPGYVPPWTLDWNPQELFPPPLPTVCSCLGAGCETDEDEEVRKIRTIEDTGEWRVKEYEKIG